MQKILELSSPVKNAFIPAFNSTSLKKGFGPTLKPTNAKVKETENMQMTLTTAA